MSTKITIYWPSVNSCCVSIEVIISISAVAVPRNTYMRVRLQVFCITCLGKGDESFALVSLCIEIGEILRDMQNSSNYGNETECPTHIQRNFFNYPGRKISFVRWQMQKRPISHFRSAQCALSILKSCNFSNVNRLMISFPWPEIN